MVKLYFMSDATKKTIGEECSEKLAILGLLNAQTKNVEGRTEQLIDNVIAARKTESANDTQFPDVLMPEQRVKYEKALAEIRPHIQKLLDELDDCTKLTADDFSIIINAR